jgi:hypothetical protein
MSLIAPSEIPQYEIFEISLPGPTEGNPFVDVSLEAVFELGSRALQVDGFYDGEGIYRIRCMPDEPGAWRYTTRSSRPELDGVSGSFTCTPALPGAHGPVRVEGTYHFAYADGTRYFPVGTTCYAWAHQGDALEERTLETLSRSPFNKLRMCIFPKSYAYNRNEPVLYPFERGTAAPWDFTRFNPAFFRHIERRVGQLRDLGIEADIILFHPYDRWGFANMGAGADDRYLRYLIARLAAYRNVWWSLANEYDILSAKTTADWDRSFRLIQACDPYGHLRSIHNWQGLDTHDWKTFYDHGQSWVTHCSIQHGHVDLAGAWRELYRKPVVIDECCYEGNLPNGWGNLTAQEMVRRFWDAAVRGGYAAHGETYLDPQEVIWWSKGGTLHGGSPERIAFYRKILEEIPGGWLEPVSELTNTHLPSAGQPGKIYLTYFGHRQPGEATLRLPEEGDFRIDVIDTWEMTVTPLSGVFHGSTTVSLPGKPYLAIRVVNG